MEGPLFTMVSIGAIAISILLCLIMDRLTDILIILRRIGTATQTSAEANTLNARASTSTAECVSMLTKMAIDARKRNGR